MPGDYDFGLSSEQEQRAAELHRTSFSVDMCSMGPRGYEDEQIKGILGENFLRVFEAVCG